MKAKLRRNIDMDRWIRFRQTAIKGKQSTKSNGAFDTLKVWKKKNKREKLLPELYEFGDTPTKCLPWVSKFVLLVRSYSNFSCSWLFWLSVPFLVQRLLPAEVCSGTKLALTDFQYELCVCSLLAKVKRFRILSVHFFSLGFLPFHHRRKILGFFLSIWFLSHEQYRPPLLYSSC